MIPVTSFSGRKVALFGLGGSGLATARALIAGGADVLAWDDNPLRVDAARKALHARFSFFRHAKVSNLRDVDWSGITALVVTAQVQIEGPSQHWAVSLARQVKAEIISDIELFCREQPGQDFNLPFIAIFRCPGSGFTKALLTHVVRTLGGDIESVGPDQPILSLKPRAAGRFHVVEVSEADIPLAPSLKPTHAVLAVDETAGLDPNLDLVALDRLMSVAKAPIVHLDWPATKDLKSRLKASELGERWEKALETYRPGSWDAGSTDVGYMIDIRDRDPVVNLKNFPWMLEKASRNSVASAVQIIFSLEPLFPEYQSRARRGRAVWDKLKNSRFSQIAKSSPSLPFMELVKKNTSAYKEDTVLYKQMCTFVWKTEWKAILQGAFETFPRPPDSLADPFVSLAAESTRARTASPNRSDSPS